MERQRVIVRFADGNLVKGYLDDFSLHDDFVLFEDEALERREIRFDEIKAIFFVKTFEGNKARNERKAFVKQTPPGKRVFVKFRDGESMTGYLEGDFPWEKGFLLEPNKGNGFFIVPVDTESNNIRVFVVSDSVWDVTALG